MDEQEQDSVLEVATQNQDAQDQQSHEEETQAHVQQEAETRQERNWREMRKRQEELENRLKQKDEMLEKLMNAQMASQTKQPEPEPEDPDEEYIPAGRVKGIARRTVQPLEQKIHELEQKIAQQEQQKIFNNLRSKYSDFDDVVNQETLELLETKEPELAAAIAENKDPNKMAIQAYKYIKALNLAEQVPTARRSKEVNKRLEENNKTVQTPMAYDKRPMAQAFKITEAKRNELYEEMMRYAGQVTGI